MGHDIGLANSYYKPSEQELLEDYIKSVNLLTINNDKSKIEKQVAELTEKSIKKGISKGVSSKKNLNIGYLSVGC